MNKKDVESFLNYNDIKNYIINDDLTVDVLGSVNITTKLENLPVKFGVVNENFICKNNNIKDFKNFPSKILGSLDISSNKLTSLIGIPIVGKSIYVNFNKITTLDGSPSVINGSFDCSHNQLTSLKNGPLEVQGVCDFFENHLINLEYAPKKVFNNFVCSANNLFNLKGCPKYIDGALVFYNNPNFIINSLSDFNSDIKSVSCDLYENIDDFLLECLKQKTEKEKKILKNKILDNDSSSNIRTKRI